jgi:hypothetical protein
MKPSIIHVLLFGPSLRGRHRTLLTLTVLTVASGWFVMLATDAIRVPGGEALGGVFLATQVAFGLLLIAVSLVGCKKLTWPEVLVGIAGGLLALASAWLFNQWPAWPL